MYLYNEVSDFIDSLIPIRSHWVDVQDTVKGKDDKGVEVNNVRFTEEFEKRFPVQTDKEGNVINSNFYPIRYVSERELLELGLPFTEENLNTPAVDVFGNPIGVEKHEALANVYMDALWHYIGARSSAEKYGSTIGTLAADFHEFMSDDQGPEQTKQDKANNAIGFSHVNNKNVDSVDKLISMLENPTSENINYLIDFVDSNLVLADLEAYHHEMAKITQGLGY